MDPNENLTMQRTIAARILEHADRQDSGECRCDGCIADGLHLADLVVALADWLRTGGFPPSAWTVIGG